MSKFLKLVEENRPGEDQYTVELRDVNGDIIDSFDLFGVSAPKKLVTRADFAGVGTFVNA